MFLNVIVLVTASQNVANATRLTSNATVVAIIKDLALIKNDLQIQT